MKTQNDISRNDLFPVFFKLEQLHVLVVGGGSIGLEKVSAIYKNSPATKVTLIAKDILDDLKIIRDENPNFTIVQREFVADDLERKHLVIAATNDKQLSKWIREESTKRKLLINVAVGSSRVDLQACKLEYSIVSPK